MPLRWRGAGEACDERAGQDLRRAAAAVRPFGRHRGSGDLQPGQGPCRRVHAQRARGRLLRADDEVDDRRAARAADDLEQRRPGVGDHHQERGRLHPAGVDRLRPAAAAVGRGRRRRGAARRRRPGRVPGPVVGRHRAAPVRVAGRGADEDLDHAAAGPPRAAAGRDVPRVDHPRRGDAGGQARADDAGRGAGHPDRAARRQQGPDRGDREGGEPARAVPGARPSSPA